MAYTIETDRILLRPFTEDDVIAVFAFGSSSEVNTYTGDKNLEEQDQAMHIIRKTWFVDYKTYGYGRLTVIHKADKKVIGFAGIKFLTELEETDLGYRFLPEYWGMGLATEVSKPLVKHTFENFKLDQLIGIAMRENIASQRVLEKIGLTWYKDDEVMGDGENHKWYKLTRKEFESKKNG